MMKLTARQKLRVAQEISKRYSATVTKAWSRAEYNAVTEAIAQELYGNG